MEITSATYTTHAKAIILGEHSIVYRGSAIVAPVPVLAITVTATINSSTAPSYDFDGSAISRDQIANYYPGIDEALNSFPLPEGLSLSLTIRSTIPESRGLGSSAASANSAVRAIYRAIKNLTYFSEGIRLQRPHLSDLDTIVARCEDRVHGRASGLDQCGVTADCTCLFTSDRNGLPPMITPLPNLNAYLVVADTGIIKNTKASVAAIKRRISAKDPQVYSAIETLSSISDSLKDRWTHNHLEEIGASMNRAQEILSSLSLSLPELDRLISLLRENGALGAKLSGGGCGGICIGLFRDIDKADAAVEGIQKHECQAWRISI